MVNNNDDKNLNDTETESKKEGFFKKVIKSVKDFDKYEDFGLEGLGQTLTYVMQIVAIFTLVIAIITLYQFSNALNGVVSYFDANITSLEYKDGNLTINEDEKLEINDEEGFFKLIIADTSQLEDEQIEQYREQLQNMDDGIILLRDKFLMKIDLLSSTAETSYEEFFTQYDITQLDKQSILSYLDDNQFTIYSSIFIAAFISNFIVYLPSILIDILVLGVLGYLTARIVGMKIRFGAAFSMGAHALTLPIILNILYVILNAFTGFTITYFQFMYTAISYIYIITAILIIKSDYIKKQAEVQKIQTEQEKIHAELERKEQEKEDEEEKQKEKKEREDQKNKEEKENKDEKNKLPGIGNRPEGNNV